MVLVLIYLNIFKLNKFKYIWHVSSFFTKFEHVNAGWILYFDGYPFLLLEGLNLLPNFEKGGGSGSTKTQVLEGGCWERGWGGGWYFSGREVGLQFLDLNFESGIFNDKKVYSGKFELAAASASFKKLYYWKISFCMF